MGEIRSYSICSLDSFRSTRRKKFQSKQLKSDSADLFFFASGRLLLSLANIFIVECWLVISKTGKSSLSWHARLLLLSDPFSLALLGPILFPFFMCPRTLGGVVPRPRRYSSCGKFDLIPAKLIEI